MTTQDFAGNGNESQDKNKRNNVALILLLFLLLASIGVNIYQYMDSKSRETTLETKILNGDDLRLKLRTQLDSAITGLEAYKGKSARQDSFIAVKEKELTEKGERIKVMLKEGKISYNKYLQAKDKLDNLNFQYQNALKELKRLEEENKKLTEQNAGLKEDVKAKGREIDKLTDDNIQAHRKLKEAEKLKLSPADITITGVKIGSGNKEKETDRARKIEKLKVSYNIHKNLAANSGKRDIYVQIIDPKGQTVAKDALGSGTMNVDEKQAQYSTKDQIDYNNEEEQNHFIYFGGADFKFEPGRYTVNIYTDGYLMGTKEIIIK